MGNFTSLNAPNFLDTLFKLKLNLLVQPVLIVNLQKGEN